MSLLSKPLGQSNPSADAKRVAVMLERRGTVRSYPFHPLGTPYTNTAFDGDSFSDVGSSTKIENTSWSTTIPAGARALYMAIVARDSGSAGTSGLHFSLYASSSASYAALSCTLSGHPNDDWATSYGIVPTTNGDIWYQCEASGASTLDVVLRCFGYWL